MRWFFNEPLSGGAIAAIRAPEADVRVSVVSIWEAEIKRALGKLEAPDDLVGTVRDHGFVELAVRSDHAVAAGRLPLHHGDPFDRMLVAQAQLEGLSLVTADEWLGRYGIHVVPVR